MDINRVSGQIIDAAMKVHSALGPGLLESAYQTCMAYELGKRDLNCSTEVELPIIYDGQRLNARYRLDMLVEELVILEIKAVEQILPIHKAQLLSYLKLSGKKVGLLLNFNVLHMKEGILRLAN